MDIVTKSELRELLVQPVGPCVSLFTPTHRGGSEQDPIRARNLLRSAEDSLSACAVRSRDVRRLLAPARRLFEDPAFWKRQSDGIACFLAPNFAKLFRLPFAFPEIATVASHFQLKPLLPLLSGEGRFYVLAISQNHVRLLQGTAHHVDNVDLTGVPTSLGEALKFSDRNEPIRLQARRPGGAGEWGRAFHGEGLGVVDLKDDLLYYFQHVDRGLHDFLRTERVPLVLASVAHLWPIYRQANTYPHLVEQGIPGNPDRLSDMELHDKAWAIVRPEFQKAQQNAASLYSQLAGTGRTTSSVEETVNAACQGRIEFLFVASGKEQWGTYMPSGAAVNVHDKKEPGDEDLLNVAAIHAILRGATVYVVPSTEVPGGGMLAGIYWLPGATKKK